MFAKRFQHLGEIERKRIVMPPDVQMRLNRLEKPEPWPPELLAEIIATFPADEIQQYPAYAPFYDKLARFAGVQQSEIVVGAGIEEFIRNLFMLCIEPGDKVAFLWPTCAMFEIYARVFQAEPVRIVTDPHRGLTLEGLAAQLDGVKLLILANPGQPVETVFGYKSLEPIANILAKHGGVLAVDEAYHGFGAPTMVGMHLHHENVVALRTFSKAFGAASIRLGYAVGGPAMIRALDAVRQSGEVSAASLHIAGALMDDFNGYVQPSIDAICQGRDALRDRVMTELGLIAWGHFANHVLIDFGNEALKEQAEDGLASHGIYVKANFPAPLNTCMLVTCGGPELMDCFFRKLRGAL
jgi:histidinol-phosphate aminotransferase